MSGRLLRVEKCETLARQADFQPAKMAALCPVSLRQLERFFALRFGKTPGEWSRELKCRQALKLITEGYSNKAMVAVSSIILRRAALDARKTGIEQFKTKLNQKRKLAAKSLPEHESNQAESLLDDINNLRRGAFAPISKNPLVGALLVNSSGAVLLELLAQVYFK